MRPQIEFDREDDGRHIAEISSLPGVLAYGATREEAEAKVEALALRVIAEPMERDNRSTPEIEGSSLPPHGSEATKLQSRTSP